MPTRQAVKNAVQAAILAGTAAFLALAGCVVAENITVVGPGGDGSGIDLGAPFVSGGKTSGTKPRRTPTPRPGSSRIPQTSAPTQPPILERPDLASDFWVEQTSGVTEDLHGVIAIPPLTGQAQVFAVGNGGTILYTADAGKTWVKQNSGTTNDLFSITYDPSAGGAVLVGGADGTLLMTTDKGTTWSALPTAVASASEDPVGTIRQVDLWTVTTKGRKAVFISTDRYPMLGAPDLRKPFEDENDPPIPLRSRLTWDFGVTLAETPTRFSFYRVTSVSAYGLVGVGDTSKSLCNSPICIGWPDMGKAPNPWRWRLTKFDGSETPEGLFRDISTVPDWAYECGELKGDGLLAAFLATDKAIYRTTDYGINWRRLPGPTGADRIFSHGKGHVVAISQTKLWYGTATYPANTTCPKGEPVFQWEQVPLAPGDIDVDLNDQFFTVIKSSDTYQRPADMWMVGRGGKIIFRKGAL